MRQLVTTMVGALLLIASGCPVQPGADTVAPVLSLPSDITVAATSAAGARVTYSASASDAVDGSVPVTCIPESGSEFAIAATEVSCRATDAAGNTATGSFTVTVVDTYTAIAPAWGHTCGLTRAGGVECWGWNVFGQLGDGSTTNTAAPVAVVGLSAPATALAAGWYHTCALLVGGAVECWGYNVYGQLGDGSVDNSAVPVGVMGLSSGVSALTAGVGHTCAVSDGGAARCWGYNQYGQLGNGLLANSATSVAVDGLASGVRSIAAGWSHTCAVLVGGAMRCWGYNLYGQLGNGLGANSPVPVEVLGLAAPVLSVAGGWGHTCAVLSGGSPRCWGYNAQGQLGNGSLADSWAPAAVSGLSSGVESVTAGLGHTCALTSVGSALCWGLNQRGQLGDGSVITAKVQVAVAGLSAGVTTLSAGWGHTCALADDAGPRCWGNNQYGQLGNDSTTNSSLPVAVGGP